MDNNTYIEIEEEKSKNITPLTGEDLMKIMELEEKKRKENYKALLLAFERSEMLSIVEAIDEIDSTILMQFQVSKVNKEFSKSIMTYSPNKYNTEEHCSRIGLHERIMTNTSRWITL